MTSEQKDVELEQWLSSYGLITIERILGTYQIRLIPSAVSALIKNRFNFYHDILQIPLKNVLNGIVIQQAHDYYVYAQKIYIDYLMSNEMASSEEAPGANVRESLEEERKELIALGEDFRQVELDNDALIARTQVVLIGLTKEWNIHLETAVQSMRQTLHPLDSALNQKTIKQAIEYGFIHCDLKTAADSLVQKVIEALNLSFTVKLKDELSPVLSPLIDFSNEAHESIQTFYPLVQEIKELARVYRQRMFDAILKAIDLIKLLPVYKMDLKQDILNKELLYFDKTIGES